MDCFYCGCILESEGEDLEFWRRGRARNEEGPVELENRSCRMGEKETKFSRCGGREMKELLKGGESV